MAEVVADVAIAERDPAEIVEIAGPREEDLAQLAAMLVARRGTPVKVQAVRNPADPDADMQASDPRELLHPNARNHPCNPRLSRGPVRTATQRRWRHQLTGRARAPPQ